MPDLGENLLRYKHDQFYTFQDSESTGLNLFYSLPWQWGIIVTQGKKVIEEHDMYIDLPNFKISAQAAAITRFDYDEYRANARPPEEVLAIIEKYLYDPKYKHVLHNGLGFDIYMHNSLRRILGLPPKWDFLVNLIDTHCIAKAYKKGIKIENSDPVTFLKFQYRFNDLVERGLKTNQTHLGKEFDIQFDYASIHRGLPDCRLLKQIFENLIVKVEI